jgi:hypothetical protein
VRRSSGQAAITGINIAAAGTASTIGGAINTLVSSGTGGIVLGIASANISPVININGNTVFSLSTSLSNAATGTIHH